MQEQWFPASVTTQVFDASTPWAGFAAARHAGSAAQRREVALELLEAWAD